MKRFLIYFSIIITVFLSSYYMFNEWKYEIIEPVNNDIFNISIDNKKDNISGVIKISWSDDIEFTYCESLINYENNRADFFQSEDVSLLRNQIDKYNGKTKYFPVLVSEYCKTKDWNKYIFTANDKRPKQIWRYDKELDIFEVSELKSFVFDSIDFWVHFWRRNYWDISLEKYFENYRNKKEKLNWFWKKNGNIIPFMNYWVSLIWSAEMWQMYAWRFLSDWNLDYCNSWLTPWWKLSVCFADIYYSYDLNTNRLYEDKICSYFIDDNWNINTLQKCFENTWKNKWYDFISWTEWIKLYQNKNKDISIIDIDLKEAWISFWWVDQTDSETLNYNDKLWYLNKRFRWQLKTYNLKEESNWSNIDNFKRSFIKKSFWESNYLNKNWNNEFLFAVVNWQFFNANKENTTLSFPVKSNWKILNSYIDNDKKKKTLIIDINGKVRIIDWYKEVYLSDDNNVEVIVWIDPIEDFSKDNSLWRTYVWITWDDRLVFFIAESKTQEEMKQIALDYGIDEQNLIMFDWWPSSQFAYFDLNRIWWWINSFYWKWEVPHYFMIYKKWIWKTIF